MSFKVHTGVVATVFALAADAFMIPSTMSVPEAKGEGIEALKTLDPFRLTDTSQYPGQIVKLPCPKCELPGGFDADMSLVGLLPSHAGWGCTHMRALDSELDRRRRRQDARTQRCTVSRIR